jgi:transcriptional regulator with XRE-family HTH domain
MLCSSRMAKSRPPRIEYPDLATYLQQSGDTQTHLAEVLDLNQAQVSRIAAGLQVPRPALAERIAAYARIPADSFLRVYLARQKRKVS